MSRQTKEAVVTLSSNSIWPWEILADISNPWPDEASAWTEFRNTRGALLTTIYAEAVTPAGIRFLAQPSEVNDVPAGASFETFIETDDGPLKIRYGIVMRSEARFYDSPAALGLEETRGFRDDFQRAALGGKWETVRAGTKIYDNSAQSLASGVGPNVSLFSGQWSAIRYFRQLGGDSFEIAFTIVMPTVFGATNGKTTVLGAADLGFTTGIGVEVDSVNDRLHLCRVTSPTTVVYLDAGVANVPVSNDLHVLRYNDLTDTLAIYKGTSTSPLGTPWVDTGHIVPHGNGYRHLGFMFKPTFLETGPQISGWEAKDSV